MCVGWRYEESGEENERVGWRNGRVRANTLFPHLIFLCLFLYVFLSLYLFLFSQLHLTLHILFLKLDSSSSSFPSIFFPSSYSTALHTSAHEQNLCFSFPICFFLSIYYFSSRLNTFSHFFFILFHLFFFFINHILLYCILKIAYLAFYSTLCWTIFLLFIHS